MSLADAVGPARAHAWTSAGRVNAAKNGFDASHLTDDEVGAIYGYTTNEGYQALNPALRGQTTLTPELDTFRQQVVSGLGKLPAFEGTTYRGENMPPSVLQQCQVGSCV